MLGELLLNALPEGVCDIAQKSSRSKVLSQVRNSVRFFNKQASTDGVEFAGEEVSGRLTTLNTAARYVSCILDRNLPTVRFAFFVCDRILDAARTDPMSSAVDIMALPAAA